MAMRIGEVREWLRDRSDDELIAIDEGGLALVVVGGIGDRWTLEVGGVPLICDVCGERGSVMSCNRIGCPEHDCDASGSDHSECHLVEGFNGKK